MFFGFEKASLFMHVKHFFNRKISVQGSKVTCPTEWTFIPLDLAVSDRINWAEQFSNLQYKTIQWNALAIIKLK